jgi:hypothetical protein
MPRRGRQGRPARGTRWPARPLAALLFTAAALAGPQAARADVLRFCGTHDRLSAADQDRLLRFSAAVREALEASGDTIALVSRAGLALGRFGVRYSHMGIALRAPGEARASAWQVRQLYFDCDERVPRIFDQGLSAFVLGAERPEAGFVSLLLLPADRSMALNRAARDDARALQLLHPQYSANAHPWRLDYQNCNQWVLELLASTWGPTPAADASTLDARAASQAWLHETGYVPTTFEVDSTWLMLAGRFIPWLRHDDHPDEDLQAQRYRVTMPESIERFVQGLGPGVRRIELCHTTTRIVMREDGPPLSPACEAGPGDRVRDLS